GQRLRTLRKQRGLSQVNLAEKLRGFSRPFITMVESGQKEPSIAFIIACTDVFGTSIDELIGSVLSEV
ncbi:MAG: helix-turn-helix transcriptional regulator, partial [Candidatus Saccharimonas sp.]|nr:helix-turn-helix transcriptional regulator [Candidatus Saccharimonas sp.]